MGLIKRKSILLVCVTGANKVQGYFYGFNRFLPLLDPAQFEEHQHKQRPVGHNGQRQEAAWFAISNLVKAIGVITPEVTGLSDVSSSSQDASCSFDSTVFWNALRNACSVYIELSFGPHSLLAVQALVALVSALSDHLH